MHMYILLYTCSLLFVADCQSMFNIRPANNMPSPEISKSTFLYQPSTVLCDSLLAADDVLF